MILHRRFAKISTFHQMQEKTKIIKFHKKLLKKRPHFGQAVSIIHEVCSLNC